MFLQHKTIIFSKHDNIRKPHDLFFLKVIQIIIKRWRQFSTSFVASSIWLTWNCLTLEVGHDPVNSCSETLELPENKWNHPTISWFSPTFSENRWTTCNHGKLPCRFVCLSKIQILQRKMYQRFKYNTDSFLLCVCPPEEFRYYTTTEAIPCNKSVKVLKITTKQTWFQGLKRWLSG